MLTDGPRILTDGQDGDGTDGRADGRKKAWIRTGVTDMTDGRTDGRTDGTGRTDGRFFGRTGLF